ncbi:MAG: NAD(P)/FAD-dependent oxidoreductase [Acidobacteria bacterium]|nr:NAD(P)/FAD-dependent oxidoreductase [Acidobacteriota bacterium]
MVANREGPASPGKHLVIIGAGPAGLTAAWENQRFGGTAVILERDPLVGGIARTVEHNGYRFDIGGHRFFTKVKEVEALWHEILTSDFIRVPRQSRILYRKKFFSYPLKPMEAFFGLGPFESFRCFLSYVAARLFPKTPEEDFETWVSNRFGQRLFSIFFKTYTEKVWGVPCTQIKAEWAAQRIRGLSLWKAVIHAFFKDPTIKTLIDKFDYPRLGPGQMWETFQRNLEERGSRVLLSRPVTGIHWKEGVGITRVEAESPAGAPEPYSGEAYISTMPIAELVAALSPAPPEPVQRAAERLRYRDFILVALMFEGEGFFTDNWVYIHSPEVEVGRIQNFNNWSREMVPREGVTCLGMEYFCFDSDEIWNRPDSDLIEQAKREIGVTGLVPSGAPLLDGAVVRMKKTYPMYDPGYRENVAIIREFLEAHLPNLQLVGRNGMHKYNNQDHAMVTGMYAVRNLYGARHDVWAVNVDEDYHEEVRELRDDNGTSAAP